MKILLIHEIVYFPYNPNTFAFNKKLLGKFLMRAQPNRKIHLFHKIYKNQWYINSQVPSITALVVNYKFYLASTNLNTKKLTNSKLSHSGLTVYDDITKSN